MCWKLLSSCEILKTISTSDDVFLSSLHCVALPAAAVWPCERNNNILRLLFRVKVAYYYAFIASCFQLCLLGVKELDSTEMEDKRIQQLFFMVRITTSYLSLSFFFFFFIWITAVTVVTLTVMIWVRIAHKTSALTAHLSFIRGWPKPARKYRGMRFPWPPGMLSHHMYELQSALQC